MGFIYKILDNTKDAIKKVTLQIAKGVVAMSGGRISPNAVTIFSAVMHIPIAYLIAQGEFGWGAVLLIIFGLFDTLDGQIARLTDKVSRFGMFLDSATDRVKEILLYVGIVYYLVTSAIETGENPGMIAAITIFALGGSVLTTYMNAWGEVVLAGHKKAGHTVNKSLRGGFLGFEVRMFLIVVGLVFGWLQGIVVFIAVMAWVTAFQRLRNIIIKLDA